MVYVFLGIRSVTLIMIVVMVVMRRTLCVVSMTPISIFFFFNFVYLSHKIGLWICDRTKGDYFKTGAFIDIRILVLSGIKKKKVHRRFVLPYISVY